MALGLGPAPAGAGEEEGKAAADPAVATDACPEAVALAPAAGRGGLACAREGCGFLVHGEEEMGGFCCWLCFQAGEHGARCERQPAPAGAKRASRDWVPAETDFLEQHMEEVVREGEPETRFSFAEAAASEGQALVAAGRLVGASRRFVQGAQLLEPLVWRDSSEAVGELDEVASALYLILQMNSAKVAAEQGDWVSAGQFAGAVVSLDPGNQEAVDLCTEAGDRVEAAIWRTDRPPADLDVVPMGHYCTTARFLQLTGWRRQALPLDWCAATFKIWQHMVGDDFATLLAAPGGEGEKHPYDDMFPDTLMFDHQGGWANEDVHRRVARLRAILQQRRAFGVAFYFEGQEDSGLSLEEVVQDAIGLVALDCGFRHIALIWLQQQPAALGPPPAWEEPARGLSVLRYAPVTELPHGETLLPADTVRLAELLEARFPEAFPHEAAAATANAAEEGGEQRRCQESSGLAEQCPGGRRTWQAPRAESEASDERDAELDEDWAGQRASGTAQ